MNSDELRHVIDEANRKFGAAIAGKDYAGLAALYTEDGKVLPPDAPIISGRQSIEGFWRTAANALQLTGATLRTIDIETAGDAAYEVGEAVLQLGAGQAKVKYLVVWRRSPDGQWQLHRDIWNNMLAS
jgi:ketosteroid isomerase-like protein